MLKIWLGWRQDFFFFLSRGGALISLQGFFGSHWANDAEIKMHSLPLPKKKSCPLGRKKWSCEDDRSYFYLPPRRSISPFQSPQSLFLKYIKMINLHIFTWIQWKVLPGQLFLYLLRDCCYFNCFLNYFFARKLCRHFFFHRGSPEKQAGFLYVILKS